jgi:L-iditol 2-dehydrogenase
MKAAYLLGTRSLEIRDVPESPLGTGEVRIRIEAALTCGTDLKVWRRGYHARMLQPPCRFGHELAGVIVETGPGVSGWREGDRVVAANSAPCGQCRPCRRGQQQLCEDLLFLNGAYAESIVVPERIVTSNLHRIPSGLDFRSAALAEPLACVLLGVEELGVELGDRILVLGSGPIGLLAAVVLRSRGARVSVAGRGGHRLGVARSLGAQEVLSVGADGDLGTVVSHAKALGGFDAVFEAVGQPRAWEAAVEAVRPGGRVNWFGGCPGGTSVRLDTASIHHGSLNLRASFHHTPEMFRKALEVLDAGAIPVGSFITAEASLSGLPAVFESLDQGGAALKTLIRCQS